MNRAIFLAQIRAKGFTGSTLDEVKQWAETNGYEFDFGAGKDLDTVWATKAAIALTPPNDETEDEDETEAENLARKSARLDAKAVVRSKSTQVTSTIGHRGSRIASEIKHAANLIASGHSRFECVKNAEQGMEFGAFVRLAMMGNKNYGRRQDDIDIVGKTAIVGDNELGGVTVPTDYSGIIIDNIEQYGAARRVCPPITMPRGGMDYTYRASDYTAVGVGENTTLTASDQTFRNIRVAAEKHIVRGQLSNELLNDSAVNFIAEASKSAARALAQREDLLFFAGTAGATAPLDTGITGVRTRLTNLSTATPNLAGGLVISSGNLFSETVPSDLMQLEGRLPEFASPNAVYVFSRQAYWQAIVSSAYTTANVGNAVTFSAMQDSKSPQLNGRPVILAQAGMPTTDANTQVFGLLGDFSRGAIIGQVRDGLQFMTSEHVGFATDTFEMRWVNRLGINVFDVGNASATAASRVAGPIVGLISASS
jgi:HK97 family phage major capsid protein